MRMTTPKMPWYVIALKRLPGGQLSQFCTFVTDGGSALGLFTSEESIERFVAAQPEHFTVHAQAITTRQQFTDLIAALQGIDPPLAYVAIDPVLGAGALPELQRLEDVMSDAGQSS
jgi:hypothetical protein